MPYPKGYNQSKRIQELVIKQQYFYASATLKDILRRFMKTNSTNWERLPDKVQLYFLDIHHSIAMLEMLRILIDEFQLTFQQAFFLTKKTFSFQTQGTVEELSMRWDLEIFSRVLPRHMELLIIIDHFYLSYLRSHHHIVHDKGALDRLTIISKDSNDNQIIRIPHFCFVTTSNIFSMSNQQLETAKSVIYRELDDVHPDHLQYIC